MITDEDNPNRDVDVWIQGYLFGVVVGTLLGALIGVGIAQVVFCP